MDNTVENSLSSPRARKEWTNSVHFRGRKIKKGPTGIAGGSSYAPVRLCYQQRPGRRIYDLTSAFLLLAARKRASCVWGAQLFSEFIPGQLMPDVLSYLCLILAHRINIVTTTLKLLITILELQVAELFIYHQADLSFQISDKRRYTHLGRGFFYL